VEALSPAEADYYRLRTEWLRYKSHLYDSLTGLPALPAVIEDIRRLVESRWSVEVLYLDLGRSGGHEAKVGWQEYDETVRRFAGLLAGLRQTGELAPSDAICLHTVRSDRFLVFLAGASEEPGDGGARRKDRLLGALRRRLLDAPAATGLRNIRISAGHGRIREDPMIRIERAVQQAVHDAMLMSLRDKEGTQAARREELARLIRESAVRSVFHPIVRLHDRSVVGHEALTRPLSSGLFDSVEELFAFAESTELLVEFERLCRRTAVRSAAALADRGLLFLNASARAVEDPDWSNGAMDRLLASSGLAPREVVVEITERVAVGRSDVFQRVLRAFKQHGYRVAVDDMGAGYASLQALEHVEPDFLKFDVSLVRDIDRNNIKRSLLETLRGLADKIRARVIAEGVEREEERETLVSLGIELGQGFFFHREHSHA
jgi:EAL domain-containing protein (putative c-di-GMP-specific phosphodiesterase class I)